MPQSIGLVRELKAGQKNRSLGKAICMESGYERASKSTTIDRSRSKDNVYEGYRSGEELWNAMVADADEYRSEYTTKTGKKCSRRLPRQAVIGVQVIINPPSEIADTWDMDTHFRFQNDSGEVLEEIEPRLFSSRNMMMRAHHFDEGVPGHATDTHTVYVAKDQDGKYCGSVYDANLRQRMALEFAQKMRERGWDIDDPEITDWDRYEEDEEYRKRIDGKRKRQGKSQPEYDAQVMADLAEQMQAAADGLQEAVSQREAAEAERDSAIAKRDEAKEERAKAEKSRKLIEGKSFKRKGVSMLGVAGLEEKRKELSEEIAALEGERDRLKPEISNLEEQYTGLVRRVRKKSDENVDASDIVEYMDEALGVENRNTPANFGGLSPSFGSASRHDPQLQNMPHPGRQNSNGGPSLE